MSKKTLEDIGERKAITLLAEICGDMLGSPDTRDDCAVIEIDGERLLISTDLIRREGHTPEASPRQMGWHLVAVNLSDIAAMGGSPLFMVTALALPVDREVSYLQELTRGMAACAGEFDTRIVGGDTKECGEEVLVGTVLGRPSGEVLYRSGAQIGDLVAVTGDIGAAATGLEALRSGDPDHESVKRLLEPWPRVREGMALAGTGSVNSCIDMSDGLSSSLHHLSRSSGVGFKIDLEEIPRYPAMDEFDIDTEEASLHFGGDYELLITLRKASLEVVRKAVQDQGTSLTVIGEVTEDRVLMDIDGGLMEIEDLGWEHFRSRSGT